MAQERGVAGHQKERVPCPPFGPLIDSPLCPTGRAEPAKADRGRVSRTLLLLLEGRDNARRQERLYLIRLVSHYNRSLYGLKREDVVQRVHQHGTAGHRVQDLRKR